MKSCASKTAEDFADQIKRQFSHFQTENIVFDLPIDRFWKSVAEFKGLDGKLCFLELAELSLHCLCISHGNAVPERGFSLNKYLLEDRSSMKERTIEALRLTKEFILLHGNKVKASFFFFK